VESGMAPARKSLAVPIPLITHRGPIINQISFPVIHPDRSVPVPPEITLGTGTKVAITPVTSVDAMARRVLRDEMPGIILRTIVRATTRAVAQAELSNQMSKQLGAAGGLLSNIGSSVANVVIEKADERVWRTLPAQISIGRARLPSGSHSLNISTPAGPQTVTVKTEGKYAVVQLRLIANYLYVLQETATPNTVTPSKANNTPKPVALAKDAAPR